jgi:ATP-dependent Clp protease ATP-binding subunit ClpX
MSSPHPPPPLPHPQQIFDELRKSVLGQDEALREVAVAIVKHLGGHAAPNMLLIGNSGSGKTTMMKAVEEWISSAGSGAANVVRINANVLAEEHGGYGKTVIARLWRNARRLLGRSAEPQSILRSVEGGVVFIDEVDKIRAHVGAVPNVRGIVAQEALLTLMENENLEFEPPEESSGLLAVNTSRMLFVAGGAFEELYDAVLRRVLAGTDAAPLRPVVVVSSSGEVREELPFHLREHLRYEDLFQYGITPQFLSRFESIVVLNDLVEDQLARIFVEPEGSIFREARDYFRRFGIDLQITRGAIRAIAWEASRHKRLGARALREIFRKVIRDLEFAPAAPEGEDGRRILMIDEEKVREVSQKAEGRRQK